MGTVTSVARIAKQPWGGYLPLKDFEYVKLEDGITLNTKENLTPGFIGTVVDYLTRYAAGETVISAFMVAINGADKAEAAGHERASEISIEYLMGIEHLDNDNPEQVFSSVNTPHLYDEQSIIAACKLVAYDIWVRNYAAALSAKTPDDINPDEDTIFNIKVMVERGEKLLEKYGGMVKSGFTFEPKRKDNSRYLKMLYSGATSYGGYTAIVSSGDGDYLTKDTLWDFKVSQKKPTSKHTLQLLMYWIMGQHSGRDEFKGITHIGFFNPRLNEIYRIAIKNIPIKTIQTVEKQVIGYMRSAFKEEKNLFM